MIRLAQYLLSRVIPWTIISLVGTVLLFLVSQGFRVAPLFVGASVDFWTGLRIVLYLLVPVAAFALAPAFLVGVFAAAGGLDEHGELQALDASGISRWKIAAGPLFLLAVIGVVVLLSWTVAVPQTGKALTALAGDFAGRAMAAQLESGRFIEPVPGYTFFAERENQTIFSGVFVSHKEPDGCVTQIVAQTAHADFQNDRHVLALHFKKGRVFRWSPRGALTTGQFDTLTTQLALAAIIRDRLDFLPRFGSRTTAALFSITPRDNTARAWRFERARRIGRPFGFALLSVTAVWFAFFISWKTRGRAIFFAACLFAGYQLLDRLGEGLYLRESIAPETAAGFSSAGLLFAVCLYALSVYCKKQKHPL